MAIQTLSRKELHLTGKIRFAEDKLKSLVMRVTDCSKLTLFMQYMQYTSVLLCSSPECCSRPLFNYLLGLYSSCQNFPIMPGRQYIIPYTSSLLKYIFCASASYHKVEQKMGHITLLLLTLMLISHGCHGCCDCAHSETSEVYISMI